jgi:hypothetical protein
MIHRTIIFCLIFCIPISGITAEEEVNLILVAIEQSDGSEKWGFIDYSGNEVIPLQYTYARIFSQGLALVANEDRMFGFINKNGRVVIPFEYEYDSSSFSEDLACVVKDGKYGFIDKEDNVVIPFIYNAAGMGFSEGLAAVGERWNKMGYINKNGELLIPMEYEGALTFSHGLAPVKKNGSWGFINKAGDLIVPCIYYSVNPFSDGLALVESMDGRVGYINTGGEFEIPLIYDAGVSFFNGTAWVKTGGMLRSDDWGIIDTNGNWIVKFQYPDIYVSYSFCEGYARVRNVYMSPEKNGHIDMDGNIVIPIIYEDILAFKNGYAGAKKNGKWGLIDKNGNLVVPYKYDWFIYKDCYK